ncbi:MAG: nickel/cobalt transporter [Alphaproteobacteria bacterium]|nr:nickel/cobalt transporter [Alphaproteobacteria bacterium]
MSIRFLSAGFLILFLGTSVAVAQSGPFGVGAPEAAPIPADGLFSDFFRWVAAQQSAFYQELTGAVRNMKQNGSAFWTLISLSFLYGVFHAAGPGHGKVVMSSYVLANRETAKRGAVLCLLSSLLQALVAIGVISILAILFNATSLVITDASRFLEVGSYVLVTVLGAYLVFKAIRGLLSAQPASHDHHHGHHHDHHHSHDHDHHHDENCGCGHAHAPSPELADQAKGSVKAAVAAIFSVGLRPCTGALIVLVFALAQGLFWAGVLSALAMGLGTAITVTTLMFLAVGTRRATLVFTGSNTRGATYVLNGIQLLGAVAVLLLGGVLLIAALL